MLRYPRGTTAANTRSTGNSRKITGDTIQSTAKRDRDMHAPLPFFRRERSLPSVTGESRRMGGDEQLYAYVLGIASAKTSRNSSEIEFAGLSASECRAMLLAQSDEVIE